MVRFLFMLISLMILSLGSVDAAVYKGQKVFVKKCFKCHGSGEVFVAKYTMKQWEKWMQKKGKPLAELHLKSKKAQKSWKYFKSKKYIQKSKHLKQFLVKYAKDSGNIPACN